MKPQIEDVTISMPKPAKFLAEMTPDLEVDEFYEKLDKDTRKLAQALLDGERRRDKQLCDGLYSCLGGVKQCNSPVCPRCVQQLRISLALAVRECLGRLLVKSELPMSFFEADGPGERCPMGRLERINLLQINHLIKGQLKALRLPLVFAGVNISLVDDRLSKAAPSWAGTRFRVCRWVLSSSSPKSTQGALPRRSMGTIPRGIPWMCSSGSLE